MKTKRMLTVSFMVPENEAIAIVRIADSQEALEITLDEKALEKHIRDCQRTLGWITHHRLEEQKDANT